MPIATSVQESLTRASWIRRMFEEGARLKELHGAENVFDFSLGNPDLEPPERFQARLRELTQSRRPGLHRYMPNAGWPEVRARVAQHLAARTGIDYSEEHVIMTVGAGGALNVLFKALLNPGDEVIVLSPYFVEYRFYIDNAGGRIVEVETTEEHRVDAAAVAAAITPRTRAVVINSPNNPTGVVYSRAELDALATALEEGSRQHGTPIYLVTDEPYRKILYEGVECPEVPPTYPHTVLITSHSKDLGLAGERIGYLAVSPTAVDAAELVGACTFCNRTLGFVNAPSLFQLAIADCLDLTVDVATYDRRRQLLLPALRDLGFHVETPGGAFYLFPRSPMPDEVEFVNRLMQHRILVVPGSGFGRGGHFRISFAVPTDVIERSLPAWQAAAAEYPQLASR